MDLYKVTIEDVALMDYIDKDVILQYTSEEQIFSLVFGYEPEEYQFTTSPLRNDTIAGAYFERYYYSRDKSKLLFKDWADPNKRLYDCFDMVQAFFGLSSFKSTLQFIKAKLIDGKPLEKIIRKENPSFKKNEGRTLLCCSTRGFNIEDKHFWEPYGITSSQLQEDKVFRVSRYFTQKPSEDYRTVQVCYTQTYVYTEFKSGNKKLYSPYKSNKFITNCSKNDIGGLLTIKSPDISNILIITKSYKDCRVLRNMGYNSVWFQNEGMYPDEELLRNLVAGYEYVVILFDNDETGVIAASKLHDIIESYELNDSVTSLHLPFYLLNEGIKDPSDLYKAKGIKELNEFLITNI